MTQWLYNNEIFELPNPNPYEGFIYLIENLTNGKLYVGKKHFWTRRKDKKSKRRVTKESDWRNYYSSSDDLLRDVELLGKHNFKRTILHLCIYKKQMTFLEQKEQWDRNVLLTDNYYNTNIAGKFFVRERGIYWAKEKQVTTKNDKWREIKSNQMKGDNNVSKREDVRKKISEKKKGEKHHQFGKPISESHKKAIFDSVVKKVTDGINIWESQSEYFRQHSKKTVRGKDGKNRIEIDGIVYDSLKEASKKINKSSATICRMIEQGKAKNIEKERIVPLSYKEYKRRIDLGLIWEI